jgi:hypothetical protein
LNEIWTILAAADTAHCNRRPFTGVLTILDEPSDKNPNGGRGHKVIVTSAAAKKALHSLIGMGISVKTGWNGHDPRQKCGVITDASIEDKKILVSGYLYARDFPDVIEMLESKEQIGMSYEVADAHVHDMRSPIWTVKKLTFTGAAILLRSKAAYKKTSFKLKPAA